MTAAELMAELSKLPPDAVVMGFPPDAERTCAVGPLTPATVAALTADGVDRWNRPYRSGDAMELDEAKRDGIPASAYRVAPGVIILQ